MNKKILFTLLTMIFLISTALVGSFLYIYVNNLFTDSKITEDSLEERGELFAATVLDYDYLVTTTTTSTIFINNNNIPTKENISEKNRIEDGVAFDIPTKKQKTLAKVAVVIDDLGVEYPKTKDFLESNLKLTFAIIPDTPIADRVYNYCIKNNLVFILHLPMEASQKKVEENAIFIKMSDDEISERVNYFFDKYDGIAGANNHMGSRATQDERVMRLLLSNIKSRDLVWLDSVTSPNRVTREVAKELSIKYLERDIFLDNEKDFQYIKKQMGQLISIAKKSGSAIGIGHVSSENLLLVLKEYSKREKEFGIKFVTLDEL